MQSKTFTAASSTLTTYEPLELNGRSPSLCDGVQVARFFAEVDSGASADDEATLELALIQGGNRIAAFTATCTALSITGASSAKLCTVSFAEGSTSKMDLLGCDSYSDDEIVSTTSPDDKAHWAFGITAKDAGITSITVRAVTTTVV